MTATECITTTKVKLRIGSKQIGAHPGMKPRELTKQLVFGSKPEMVESQNSVILSDTLKTAVTSIGSKKRGLLKVGDGQTEKRRKMDRSVTQQCGLILKRLMTHPAGWVFIQPVDPVKLQIPDYFQIISEPMDLGTVKRKLSNNGYSSVDQFTGHVRLTFSNAMTYNPPDNNVHLMAKELNDLFDSEWNVLEAKWSGGREKVQQQRKDMSEMVKQKDNSCKNEIKNSTLCVKTLPKRLISAMEKHELKAQQSKDMSGIVKHKDNSCKNEIKTSTLCVKPVPKRLISAMEKQELKKQQSKDMSGIVKHKDNSCKNEIKTSTLCVKTVPKRLISAIEKQDLKEQLLTLVRGKVPSRLQGFLKKSGFDPQRLDRIENGIDALDDVDLWELRKIISSLAERAAKVAPAKDTDCSGQQSHVKITCKGADNGIQSTSGSANVIPPSRLLTSVCGLCRSIKCTCHKQSDIAHASTDTSSDGSLDHLDVPMRERGVKLHSDPPLCKSELESKRAGCASSKNRMSSCPSVSTVDTSTASAGGCAPLVDVPLSSQKALRAALLKSRFVDTILKAKQNRDHGDKADPVKFQLEKERLKRQQQEERARIEAEIRALEEAARVRAETEKKLLREREREAARLALQQMEKTVEIGNDHKILKDLELLSGCSLSDQYSCGSCNSSPEVGSGVRFPFSRALEQLGLFIKDDDTYEDEEVVIEVFCRHNL